MARIQEQRQKLEAKLKEMAEDGVMKTPPKETVAFDPPDEEEDMKIEVGTNQKEKQHLLKEWKSHTNLTHPGKYFRPSKVKIMRPTSPK